MFHFPLRRLSPQAILITYSVQTGHYILYYILLGDTVNNMNRTTRTKTIERRPSISDGIECYKQVDERRETYCTRTADLYYKLQSALTWHLTLEVILQSRRVSPLTQPPMASCHGHPSQLYQHHSRSAFVLSPACQRPMHDVTG
jgi:hypothetical protein